MPVFCFPFNKFAITSLLWKLCYGYSIVTYNRLQRMYFAPLCQTFASLDDAVLLGVVVNPIQLFFKHNRRQLCSVPRERENEVQTFALG